MKLLKDLVGEEILASIPMMDPVIFQVLHLHAVDEGGIWVENKNLTEMLLTSLKQVASPKTPVFYIPFQNIRFLMQSTDKTSLSEKAFGV